MKLTFAHLYPRLMNLYGDTGNIIALRQRCRWRGIGVEIAKIHPGTEYDLLESDLIFIGGGQDREQHLIHTDLMQRKQNLLEAVENDIPLLAICGGYQLLGRSYITQEEKLSGIGLFNLHTEAGKNSRKIGNIVIRALDSDLAEEEPGPLLVGFENHAGETTLGSGALPLGEVVTGYGNNSEGKYEGCRYRNAVGTYLHGALLPKNPHLADYLLKAALTRKYGPVKLCRLSDELEEKAHQDAVKIAHKKNAPRKSGGRWSRLHRVRNILNPKT